MISDYRHKSKKHIKHCAFLNKTHGIVPVGMAQISASEIMPIELAQFPNVIENR